MIPTLPTPQCAAHDPGRLTGARKSGATQPRSLLRHSAAGKPRWVDLADALPRSSADQCAAGPDPIQGARLLGELLASKAEIVKQSARRTVYRVDAPHGRWFLKHDRPARLRRWLAGIVASGARREFQAAQRLTAHGLATAAPIGWIEFRRGPRRGESLLVTEELQDCFPLDRVAEQLALLPRRAQAAGSRELSLALARLVAQVHVAGFEHGDLHAGNLLVPLSDWRNIAKTDRRGDVAAPRLFLIDLATSRAGKPFGQRRAEAALVRLAASFRAWLSPVRLRRFLRAYAAAAPAYGPIVERWESIARRAEARSARIARRRDRRAWQTNRDFRQLRNQHGRASFAADLEPSSVERLVADAEGALALQLHAPLKLGPASQVYKVELPLGSAGAAIPAVWKRVAARSVWQSPWAWWARRRAKRAWSTACALASRGLPVAKPLAVVLPRRGGAAHLISAYVPGAVNLHLFAWELARRPAGDRAATTRQVARQIGRLVGQLHAWRISHRDLKGCNLMVLEQGDELETLLVDLDGIVVRRWLSRRERIRNLARLAASLRMHPWIGRADAARFLQAYARQVGADLAERKRLWREISSATARLERRRQRRQAAVG